MKYLRLFENFESYDPYELMIISPQKKAKMIMQECEKDKPNLHLIRDLITLGADVNWYDEEETFDLTALHKASRYGHKEIARMLIDAGADINIKDGDGWTPLHWASNNSQIEITKMLIDAGADENVQDNKGRTPLHMAARWNEIEVAKILIDAGSRFDIETNSGYTPYQMARKQEMKNILSI